MKYKDKDGKIYRVIPAKPKYKYHVKKTWIERCMGKETILLPTRDSMEDAIKDLDNYLEYHPEIRGTRISEMTYKTDSCEYVVAVARLDGKHDYTSPGYYAVAGKDDAPFTSIRFTRKEAELDLQEYVLQNPELEITPIVTVVFNKGDNTLYHREVDHIPVVGEILGLDFYFGEKRKYIVLERPDNKRATHWHTENYDESVETPIIYISRYNDVLICDDDCLFFASDGDLDWVQYSCKLDSHVIYESEGTFFPTEKITNHCGKECPVKKMFDEKMAAMLGISVKELDKMRSKG